MKIREFISQNSMRISITVICILVVIILGIGVSGFMQKSASDKEILISLNGGADKTVNTIYVHVKGAVKNPGLYELQRGDRVFQAIEAAGGLADGVLAESINLAGYVEDGQEIHIVDSNSIDEKDDGKVNINTASAYELTSLPGIGEAIATRIVEYREKNGSFTSIDGLKKINGISANKFSELKDYVKIGEE